MYLLSSKTDAKHVLCKCGWTRETAFGRLLDWNLDPCQRSINSVRQPIDYHHHLTHFTQTVDGGDCVVLVNEI